MKTDAVLTVCSIVLGVLSLVAIVFAHLALTDIYHGESDLVLEWNIVRGAAVGIVAFIGMSLIALGRSPASRSR